MRHELRIEAGGREHVLSFDTAEEVEAYAARLSLRHVADYAGDAAVVHQWAEPEWEAMTQDDRAAWPDLIGTP